MNTVQYTIRNIPKPVDQVIRKRAKASGKSFNQTVVDMLQADTLGDVMPIADSDFSWLKGSMQLDNDYYSAIANQSKVEKLMWQ